MNQKIGARIQWPQTEGRMRYFWKSQGLVSEVQNCIEARDRSASSYLNKPHGTPRASLGWVDDRKPRATCLEWLKSYREEVLPWQQKRFLSIFLMLNPRKRGYRQKKKKKAERLPVNCTTVPRLSASDGSTIVSDTKPIFSFMAWVGFFFSIGSEPVMPWSSF